jgi:putative transcriptional regulator
MSIKLHKGNLLIAEPSIIGDVSFHRAVVLISEIHDKAPLGFILNKPFDFTLSDVLPEVNTAVPLYYGGPVDPDELFFIHSAPNLIDESVSIDTTLYFGGNIDQAIDALEKEALNSSNSRFFLGYSGWSKGQLEHEIEFKNWFISQNNNGKNIISQPTEELWKDLLLKKGGKYLLWANTPNNPTHN